MTDIIRLTPMHGFTASIAHVLRDPVPNQAAGIAIGLDGEGDDRRLALTLRHADGTALVCYLSDAGMGRLGDLIVRVYGESVVAAATTVVGSVQ
ncbi:hypothetical protein [Sphingomonas aquatilis]|jgi:hypothetical protein|uniref:hypothetical protein n=1 Tax=Sphingomonas TaxID=13687 RepID=UPI002F3466A9